ncbi:MAG: bifunctional 4-hydroxy-2-oxoglutarate aldolase/2-dehydro-3-deoxy-phosphogluconate aldolase [Victivallaceae bacterium]|jgi:2-dehydro-3-deoxyphosphogluconate aldolase/(4S)-4-hydroxy-2-oxoglutarate aldolase|nr:bifunctional 4-hydroxy-2-oxoglutarate aldolase/2-dehydro-3-deoxy-phosphogluconate aldolase [Victivallaceae bacterium]MDD3703409.1 bifunctional 4-hydroxy-2-oxoglutarate aldolase/2-dehydro-3-deoxy-phosphogluconate aldolase [Victivallaceae bacterium]MDD4316970.1 bifunctional 4-hydroxy-2-oxoglutarate aldolase/2-dehydro-3-deoxy-phosphogluconate aldolase [Victivallaceae bacterium]
MRQICEQLGKLKIVPVIAIEEAENANNLAEALVEGNLPCAEITFRTAAAAESIRVMARRKDILVGAGTVITVSQVKQAVDNGAKFIVSPGFVTKVVEYCIDNHIPVLPGICTPTELCLALEYGLDVVKFFPAEAYGGIKTLKAISAPFANMRFVPTGGIDASNLLDYLNVKKVLACGGSWMVKSNLIAEQKFEEITRLSLEATSIFHKI